LWRPVKSRQSRWLLLVGHAAGFCGCGCGSPPLPAQTATPRTGTPRTVWHTVWHGAQFRRFSTRRRVAPPVPAAATAALAAHGRAHSVPHGAGVGFQQPFTTPTAIWRFSLLWRCGAHGGPFDLARWEADGNSMGGQWEGAGTGGAPGAGSAAGSAVECNFRRGGWQLASGWPTAAPRSWLRFLKLDCALRPPSILLTAFCAFRPPRPFNRARLLYLSAVCAWPSPKLRATSRVFWCARFSRCSSSSRCSPSSFRSSKPFLRAQGGWGKGLVHGERGCRARALARHSCKQD
jgi:hypothetical protein